MDLASQKVAYIIGSKLLKFRKKIPVTIFKLVIILIENFKCNSRFI